MAIHRVLAVGRWVVDFIFATKYYDVDGILSCLYDAGAPRWVMENAGELMSEGKYNTGFTYTNPAIHRAVMVVGPTTSGAEFANTISHELYHLAVAISGELGIDLEGEAPAYLLGDTLQSLVSVVCELGCDKCNHKNLQ